MMTVGYKFIALSKNGKIKYIAIHQLVAMAFLNHIPNGYKFVINHKDFNKLNNHVDNIEIVTMRENSNMKHIKHSSKYTGVSFVKKYKTWKVGIRINNKTAELLWRWSFPIKKKYRGMSTKAVQRSWGKTNLVTAEGITKYQRVEYTLEQWTENFKDYLRSAMSYCNA